MYVPLQPYLPWKIAMTVIHAIAIPTVFLRIEYRRRCRRLWWDDYAAVVPAFTESLTVVILWLRVRHYSAEDAIRLQDFKMDLRILTGVFFYTTVWWSRISMALALMRITPEWSKSRSITLYAVVVFVFTWTGLLLFYILPCEIHKELENGLVDIPQCGWSPHTVSYVSIATDIASDIYLAALPLYRLWRLQLRPSQRRLVRLVFSTSLITLVITVAILVAIYSPILKGPGASVLSTTMAQVEEASAVVASNLTVLISWGYKVFSGRDDMDAASNSHVNPHQWSGSSSSCEPPKEFVLNELSANSHRTFDGINSNRSVLDSLPRSFAQNRLESLSKHTTHGNEAGVSENNSKSSPFTSV